MSQSMSNNLCLLSCLMSVSYVSCPNLITVRHVHVYVSCPCLCVLSNFHVHDICPCLILSLMSVSHIHVSHLCLMFMSHFHVSCLCVMFMSHVHVLWPCHRCMFHVNVSCSCIMSCPYLMSFFKCITYAYVYCYVSWPSSCLMSMSHLHDSCHVLFIMVMGNDTWHVTCHTMIHDTQWQCFVSHVNFSYPYTCLMWCLI